MKKNRIVRIIIQIIAFLLVPGMFVNGFSAVKRIAYLFSVGQYTGHIFVEPVFVLLATVLSTILFGRYFCGYLCSFGAMQDLFGFLGKKCTKKQMKLPKKVEFWLGALKYVILVALVAAVVIDKPLAEEYSPWTAFGQVCTIWSKPNVKVLVSPGGVLLLALVVVALFFHRFFCKFLCPLGAIYSILARRHIVKNGKSCGNGGDCAMCGYRCARGSNSTRHLVISIILFAVPLLFLQLAIYQTGDLTSETIEPVEEAGFVDGTFTGSAEGYRGETCVSVTVADGEISEIVIDSYEDDRSYMKKAEAAVIPAILQGQTTDVDTVSGATYSSNSIIDAVNEALGIEKQVAGDGSIVCPKDGVYEGKADGFCGELTVSVTVKRHKVKAIQLVSYYDNEEYLFHAVSTVFEEIVETQNLNVDAVSGATYSRNGLVNAVADALGMDRDSYELPEARGRAKKNKQQHHRVRKVVDQEAYEELVEKYRNIILSPDGKNVMK